MDSDLLKDFHQISIHTSRNRSDIKLYIREIVDERIRERIIVIKESSMAKQIKQCLIWESGGMYSPVVLSI